MAVLSPILHSWHSLDGRFGLTWWCPGCQLSHSIRIGPASYLWDGDSYFPTMLPDVDIDLGSGRRCHCRIQVGRVKFYDDCTHALAGMLVPLPPIPDTGHEDSSSV